MATIANSTKSIRPERALWRGRSVGEPIASGTKVRVRGVDGLVLKVEPEAEPLPAND